MALILRAYDYRRSTRNRGFLVGRRAVLRLRLNIIESWTALATRIALRSGAKSRDIATDLASSIPSIHREIYFFHRWNTP